MIWQILLFVLRLLTSAPAGPPPHQHTHERTKFCIPQTASPGPFTQPAATRHSTSRIADRAIQTLWQTNLLVCHRKGPRSEVLFVCESPRRFQTRNGLCSTRIQRTGGAAPIQLQIGARNSGRRLQHQSRIVIPTRGVLAAQCLRLFARQRSPCLVFL
jgi:hypothetical protein